MRNLALFPLLLLLGTSLGLVLRNLGLVWGSLRGKQGAIEP